MPGISTVLKIGLQNTYDSCGGNIQFRKKLSPQEKRKERKIRMTSIKGGIVSKAIQVRRRREEKIFKSGILAGGLAMMIVCRILFKIKCRRCKKKNKK